MSGRPRRGRTGGGGLFKLFGMSLAVREGWLGVGLSPKENLGIGQKKAQNGIKTKNISATTSASSQKQNSLMFCFIFWFKKRR